MHHGRHRRDGGGGETLGPALLLPFPWMWHCRIGAALSRGHTRFEDEENKRTRPGILALLFMVL
jgi:hypothetical protein